MADKPTLPVELWLDIMTDTSKVQRNALGLDGLYIEFQPEMLQPEGKARLQKLTAAVGAVGVWGRAVAATLLRTPTLTLIRTLIRKREPEP